MTADPASFIESRALAEAAYDFFHFQNRGYPRRSALQWVGNRHGLRELERQALHRGVFSQREALKRRAKRAHGSSWRRRNLVVDGHNVHITVESGLAKRFLLLANDGALRDLAGQSYRYRISEISESALNLIFKFLERVRPPSILFLFDAPMSHSGHLAELYRKALGAIGLRGDARAVPVPEREIPYGDSVVATSDHAILDACREWVDVARCALSLSTSPRFFADFSRLLMTRPGLDSALHPGGHF